MKTLPVAYSYVRFSTPEQRRGDSLRRQTEVTVKWCEKSGARLDTSLTFHDLGKSAYFGEHRKNPDRHALAAFLKMVEDGKVPRGSYLVIESLDRLTREHVRAGLMLLLGLIEAGIRIVQLSPSEMLYDEGSDEMALMIAIVELSRGHRESKRKSDVIGPVWRKKKAAAREGKIITRRLPAWVEVRDGRLALIPEKADTVRLLFRLSAAGYGQQRIVAKMTRDGVPPLAGGAWEGSYVGKILRDRRALGDYQPRGKGRKPDAHPVPNYFPPVVSEAEFHAARAGAAQRKRAARGRIGDQVNVFAKMIHDARDGSAYYMTARVDRGNRYHVLSNLSSQGRAKCNSIPYLPFERAFLSLLREVDPGEVMGHDGGPDEVLALAGEVERVQSSIAAIVADMDAHGESPTLFQRLRAKEEEKHGLDARLAEARQKAAHPLAESWGASLSLAAALDGAPDPDDARLRLRSALRRVVEDIRMLVVAKGVRRVAALQVYFNGNGHRDYVIYYRPAHYGFGGRVEAEWEAASLSPSLGPVGLDLRDPTQAARLAETLAAVTAKDLTAALARGAARHRDPARRRNPDTRKRE
jgi:DNA invertase Pin-like site-specific DNA recombinase